ncbi:MAG: YerC/YecD family TrpR-related protein [Parcubacteria group bacterium]
MPQYVHKKFPYEKQDKLLEEFCEVLQSLKTVKDKMYFLKDLLNRGERIMLFRRFEIAKMLESGATYSDIRKELGSGKTTIAHVEQRLNFGRGGYKEAIKKFLNKKKNKS